MSLNHTHKNFMNPWKAGQDSTDNTLTNYFFNPRFVWQIYIYWYFTLMQQKLATFHLKTFTCRETSNKEYLRAIPEFLIFERNNKYADIYQASVSKASSRSLLKLNVFN